MVWNRADLVGHDVGSIATDVTDVPDCQLYCRSNNAPFFTLKPSGCYCKASKSGARAAPGPGYISGEAFCGGSGMLREDSFLAIMCYVIEKTASNGYICALLTLFHAVTLDSPLGTY